MSRRRLDESLWSDVFQSMRKEEVMNIRTTVALLGLGMVTPVFAQNSVSIYGLVDAGITRVSNQGGSGVTKLDDGIYAPNLLGFQGNEDLGGGIEARFLLETQFDLGTGTTIPGPGLFWRQSYITLDFKNVGSISAGQQIDFMGDFASALNDPGLIVGSLYAFSGGPFAKLGIPLNITGGLDWDRTSGISVANSLKFQSATFGGASFGALYGLKEGSGDRTLSAGIRYDDGPLGANAAYTKVDYAAGAGAPTSIRNFGIGGHYVVGSVIGNALLTTAENVQSDAKVRQIRVGAKWDFSGPWSIAGSLAYAKGNAQLDNNHATQWTSTLAYAFSKRTLAYVQGVHQKTNAGGQAHLMGVMDPAGASSTSSQSVMRVGLHTSF